MDTPAIGGSPAAKAGRERGQEYLLSRHLFKQLSTGKPIEHDRKGGPIWTQFSYPAGWHYDILRGLLYLRNAGVAGHAVPVQSNRVVQIR